MAAFIATVVCVINQATTEWIAGPNNMPSASGAASVGYYQGTIFIAGGANSQQGVDNNIGWGVGLIEYNIIQNTFSYQQTFFPQQYGPYGSSSTQVDATLYILSKTNREPYIHSFDLSSKIFTPNDIQIPSRSQSSHGVACLASANNNLYVIGGSNNVAPYDSLHTLQIYNVQNQMWSDGPSMNTARAALTCIVSTTNDLYAIGGAVRVEIIGNGIRPVDTASIEYISTTNIANNDWQSMQDQLPAVCVQGSAVQHDDKVFVIGCARHANKDVYIIDTNTNQVSLADNELMYPLRDNAVINVDDIIYAFGGFGVVTQSGYQSVWQYMELGSSAVSKIPYTWFDFNYVHNSNVFINDPDNTRAQIATKGIVALTNSFPTSTTMTNDGLTQIGVFQCENNHNFKHSAAYLPGLTYDSFALEVVVKMNSKDDIFGGYILGIEDTFDNTQGNSISFLNKFFAENINQNGWRATNEYWNSVGNTANIELDVFYHVIVSQDANGLVRVYVNGAEYGSSYMALGGAKSNQLVFNSIWLCGDYMGNSGIEASISAFGFYTESFDSEADAKASCLAVDLTDCDGIPLIPSKDPTHGPTLSPVVQCVKGLNYWVDGIPAFATGDPHFRTFNGDYHDFMGRAGQQYYYMHPCLTSTRDDMPFSILGYHYRVGISSVTTLDYITIELYDYNGDVYYVWLSTSIHSFASAATSPSSLYDVNVQNNIKGVWLTSGFTESIGQRFKITYTQTSADRIDVILEVTHTDCTVQLYMSGGSFSNGRNRQHYLQVDAPQCYLCHTCGLFGDLKRGAIPGDFGFLRACNGAAISYKRGWDTANPRAYDFKGWGWGKIYVDNMCAKQWTRQNRRRSLATVEDNNGNAYVNYEFDIPHDFIYINPCDANIERDVVHSCQTARDGGSGCCNLIGGGFCDELQNICEFDACANVMGNIDLIDEQIEILFNKPLQLICSMPDVDTQLNPNKLIEAPSAPNPNFVCNAALAIQIDFLLDTESVKFLDDLISSVKTVIESQISSVQWVESLLRSKQCDRPDDRFS
eukprot:286535_1